MWTWGLGRELVLDNWIWSGLTLFFLLRTLNQAGLEANQAFFSKPKPGLFSITGLKKSLGLGLA